MIFRKRQVEKPAFPFPGVREAMDGSAAVVEVETAASEAAGAYVGSSRVDLQACKLEYSIVSPK